MLKANLFGPYRTIGPVDCQKDRSGGCRLSCTIFLMLPEEIQMPSSNPGIVGRIEVCNLGQEGPWISRKRMEEDSIYHETYNLLSRKSRKQ